MRRIRAAERVSVDYVGPDEDRGPLGICKPMLAAPCRSCTVIQRRQHARPWASLAIPRKAARRRRCAGRALRPSSAAFPLWPPEALLASRARTQDADAIGAATASCTVCARCSGYARRPTSTSAARWSRPAGEVGWRLSDPCPVRQTPHNSSGAEIRYLNDVRRDGCELIPENSGLSALLCYTERSRKIL